MQTFANEINRGLRHVVVVDIELDHVEGTAFAVWAPSAKRVSLVGEFNNWLPLATPMKRLKTGAFSATVDLETGRSYQFRYLLEQSRWENEPDADDYSPTPYGDSDNSVIIL